MNLAHGGNEARWHCGAGWCRRREIHEQRRQSVRVTSEAWAGKAPRDHRTQEPHNVSRETQGDTAKRTPCSSALRPLCSAVRLHQFGGWTEERRPLVFCNSIRLRLAPLARAETKKRSTCRTPDNVQRVSTTACKMLWRHCRRQAAALPGDQAHSQEPNAKRITAPMALLCMPFPVMRRRALQDTLDLSGKVWSKSW